MKANLKHNYFSSPWVGASTVAAIILLILTTIQTILSIIRAVKMCLIEIGVEERGMAHSIAITSIDDQTSLFPQIENDEIEEKRKVDHLIININERMDDMFEDLDKSSIKSRSILKVNVWLRESNSDAYTPKMIEEGRKVDHLVNIKETIDEMFENLDNSSIQSCTIFKIEEGRKVGHLVDIKE
ncbi:hypothetical protein H5410_019919 [Solanum commersonii]|uniref:Uncharacterized protein n=1 Tax=Solanum commersonii TaxID=4109 RepID=A0A9J5ZCM6_SOLCO|nr:hypothetical protein H5410_019919 [Solanum commersonii]